MNAITHHDILTLPMGENQTIVTETLDLVDDATARIPMLGGVFYNLIKGIHGVV